MAERIAAYFDECSHVCIPFVGGASILPYLSGKRLVCNDLNNLALMFYEVASTHRGQTEFNNLMRKCATTLSHPQVLVDARVILANSDMYAAHEIAWAYWAFCWVGRGGQGGTEKITDQTKASFRMSNSGGSNATRINTAASELLLWAAYFRNCEWTCMDFRELATKLHDKADCGSYWDPPWVEAGERYVHKFTEQDHRDMAAIVGSFDQHVVVIRYGDHPLIRELYPEDRWNIIDAKSRSQSNAEVDEIWITRSAIT